MPRPVNQLRRDALQIWQAGVEAVRSPRLVRKALRVEGRTLVVGSDLPCATACLQAVPMQEPANSLLASKQWHTSLNMPDRIPLDSIRRIAVVGAGKAGAGMAEAVEEVLGPQLMAEKQLVGWVNVPADCVKPLRSIHLHAARPAGANEPMPEGVAGTQQILRLVESLGPDDLCLCLISGGGSALMPAPVEGVALADKLALTRHLSAAGANIEQLNAVRKQLSRIKGGGLLRACRAGRLASLIISDVLGDPLDVIASGPTVPDASTPQAALDVLEQFSACSAGVSPAVFEYLRQAANSAPFSRRGDAAQVPGVDAGAKRGSVDAGAKRGSVDAGAKRGSVDAGAKQKFVNLVIGNNATAVEAAGAEARRLGYAVATRSAAQSEGPAEEVGRRLADEALKMRARAGPTCLVDGGEPVVKLVDAARRGLGGRNQQLVLAALLSLSGDGAEGMAVLSGGTDGEDGPTNAAGAFVDAGVLATSRQKGLDPADYLARNDAYHFFEPLGALIKTGPTHTNVCDVRVVVSQRGESV